MSQEDSSTPVEQTQPTADSVTPEVPTTEQSEVTTPEVTYLQLDRSQLYRELARHEAEDPEFKQILNTYIGNKSARQYQPQLREAKATIARLEKENFDIQARSMSEEDIEKKVASDREWGKRYIDWVHEKRQPVGQQVVDETPLIQDAVAEVRDYAWSNGLPESEWNAIAEKAKNGAYEAPHWSVSVARMQQDVATALLKTNKTAAVTPPTTNPALSTKGPDMQAGTGGAGGSTGKFPTTAAEFNSLPRERQVQLLQTDRDKVIALSRK